MVSVQENEMDEILLREEETTMEYRVMMAYAQRTMSASKHQRFFRNQPSGQGAEEAASNWEGRDGENPDVELTKAIAHKVQDIVQRITERSGEDGGFRSFQRACSLEADGDDDDELIAKIVEILRSSGDTLNEQLMKDKNISRKLQSSWSYDFFKTVVGYYLFSTAPASESEYEQQTSEIALCIHATTKLTTLDNQPMNRVLGFGACYLQENYTPWIYSHGGWEKVLGVKEEEDVE